MQFIKDICNSTYLQQYYLKNIQMLSYNLSYSLFSHSKDVRSIDIHQNTLITGGSDNTVCIYARKGNRFEEISKCNIFESYIYAVKINPYDPTDFTYFIGCKDSKIYILDGQGNPVKILNGHESVVCSLAFYNKQTIVSGSWDGSANVWAFKYGKVIKSLKGHSHAVSVYCDQEAKVVITASQDKTINIWEFGTWKNLKKIENAHGDIIREISSVEGVGFITCSNDQSVKVWTYQGEQILNHLGHSAFIFTVKAKTFGQYFSGGDDKTVRVWDNDKCIQTIGNPGSIWSLVIDNNDDIITAGSDGCVRIFTKDPTRKANEEDLLAYNSQCIKANAKKAGMTPQQISKLPPVEKMALHRGKKQGQIKIFRQNNIPFAYSWKTTKWEKVGEVISESGGNSEQPKGKKYYDGDKYFPAGEYDYIFDVDDESGVPKTIPFNDGDNALLYAQKYCKRQGLGIGYVDQIRKFLTQNSKNIPRNTKMEQQIPVESLSKELELIPVTQAIEFTGIANSNGLKTKLFQFNEQIDEKNKLSVIQKGHIQRFINLLEKGNYHTWTLDFKELDAFKKILTWPEKLKLPVWDILRAYLNHYQSEEFFSGLDAGMDILGPICILFSTATSPQAICALGLRVFSNMFIQNTNKYSMVRNAEVIIESLTTLSNRGLTSKNFLLAFSSVISNYSIGLLQKPVEKQQIIYSLLKLIESRLKADNNQDNQYNYLVAAGNLLKQYPSIKSKAQFIRNYLGGNPISRDLQRLL